MKKETNVLRVPLNGILKLNIYQVERGCLRSQVLVCKRNFKSVRHFDVRY